MLPFLKIICKEHNDNDMHIHGRDFEMINLCLKPDMNILLRVTR